MTDEAWIAARISPPRGVQVVEPSPPPPPPPQGAIDSAVEHLMSRGGWRRAFDATTGAAYFYDSGNPSMRTWNLHAWVEHDMVLAELRGAGFDAAPLSPNVEGHPTAFEWREKVVSLYQRFNPAKLLVVDELLQRYEGRELELWRNLVSKYGTQQADAGAVSPMPGTPSHADRSSPTAVGVAQPYHRAPSDEQRRSTRSRTPSPDAQPAPAPVPFRYGGSPAPRGDSSSPPEGGAALQQQVPQQSAPQHRPRHVSPKQAGQQSPRTSAGTARAAQRQAGSSPRTSGAVPRPSTVLRSDESPGTHRSRSASPPAVAAGAEDQADSSTPQLDAQSTPRCASQQRDTSPRSVAEAKARALLGPRLGANTPPASGAQSRRVVSPAIARTPTTNGGDNSARRASPTTSRSTPRRAVRGGAAPTQPGEDDAAWEAELARRAAEVAARRDSIAQYRREQRLKRQQEVAQRAEALARSKQERVESKSASKLERSNTSPVAGRRTPTREVRDRVSLVDRQNAAAEALRTRADAKMRPGDFDATSPMACRGWKVTRQIEYQHEAQ